MNKLNIEFLESKIKNQEYISHKTENGKIFRWCLFTLTNGFVVVGKPSVCIDPINDVEEIGNQIAYDNSFEELWKIEGYLLQEKLYNFSKYERTTQG